VNYNTITRPRENQFAASSSSSGKKREVRKITMGSPRLRWVNSGSFTAGAAWLDLAIEPRYQRNLAD
jgi:hypothetical protein